MSALDDTTISYDRKKRVWRAYKNGIEIANQYHRSELVWILEHMDGSMGDDVSELVIFREPIGDTL